MIQGRIKIHNLSHNAAPKFSLASIQSLSLQLFNLHLLCSLSLILFLIVSLPLWPFFQSLVPLCHYSQSTCRISYASSSSPKERCPRYLKANPAFYFYIFMHRNNSKINKIDKGKGMQYLKLIICMTMSLFNECRTGQAESQSSLVQKNFSPNFIFTIDANDRQRAAWHEKRAQTIRSHFFNLNDPDSVENLSCHP